MQSLSVRLISAASVAAAVLLVPPLSSAAEGPPSGQSGRVVARLTSVGARLIAEGRLREAIQELDNAIQADAAAWEPHYQKGRALGLLERYSEARDSLLTAARLNPGHPHTHYLAWLAAYRVGDYENAWDQSIRASLAGINMNDEFMELFEASEPPFDFARRVRAPRIYVADIDTSEILARAAEPFNRKPAASEAPALGGRPSRAMGADRILERRPELVRVARSVREGLADSRYCAVVLRPTRAQYRLEIALDAIGAAPPVELQAYVRIFEAATGEAIYYRRLMLRDISAEAVLFGEVQRFVAELERWLAARGEERN